MIVLRFIVEIKVACANFDNSSITSVKTEV